MDDVLRQAIALSSGTIATLIGNGDMAAGDAAQAAFVQFVEARPNTFQNWQAAWLAWASVAGLLRQRHFSGFYHKYDDNLNINEF